MTRAARGAINFKNDNSEQIIEGVTRMVDSIFNLNSLKSEDCVSLIFSVTHDLVSINPAKALRTGSEAYSDIPLFCTVEPDCTGSMPKVVRVMITFNTEKNIKNNEIKHVYLGDTVSFRPDLK